MNDNISKDLQTAQKIVSSLTDEDKIDLVKHLFDEGLEMETHFVERFEDGVFTHEFVSLSCGEWCITSRPFELALPLKPSLDHLQTEVTIN